MSRRRQEFVHRTAIFEGAYRAWSYLANLDPDVLQKTSVQDLDPLMRQPRSGEDNNNENTSTTNNNSSSGADIWPYEPLPRIGLQHPFVKAIMPPWLGPDADQEAANLGLATLRTWWQHRRKGPSVTAQNSLANSQTLLEKYTLHFFQLAHCLVLHDHEQPPKTLKLKLKQRRMTVQRLMRGGRPDLLPMPPGMDSGDGSGGENLNPLERLHFAQRQQMREDGIESSNLDASNGGSQRYGDDRTPIVDVRGKCMPGKIDLPGMMKTIERHQAQQLAHRGGGGGNNNNNGMDGNADDVCGDPKEFPVVIYSVSSNTATTTAMIALSVDGIVCAHCAKIVETVLQGCQNKSPINGVLDAVADQACQAVLLRIDVDIVAEAPRIAHHAAQNLKLVGYTATPVTMPKVKAMKASQMESAFRNVGNALGESGVCFNWDHHCLCPGTGVKVGHCQRHAAMHRGILDQFRIREKQVMEYFRSGRVAPQCMTPRRMEVQQQQRPQMAMELHRQSSLSPVPMDSYEDVFQNNNNNNNSNTNGFQSTGRYEVPHPTTPSSQDLNDQQYFPSRANRHDHHHQQQQQQPQQQQQQQHGRWNGGGGGAGYAPSSPPSYRDSRGMAVSVSDNSRSDSIMPPPSWRGGNNASSAYTTTASLSSSSASSMSHHRQQQHPDDQPSASFAKYGMPVATTRSPVTPLPAMHPGGSRLPQPRSFKKHNNNNSNDDMDGLDDFRFPSLTISEPGDDDNVVVGLAEENWS